MKGQRNSDGVDGSERNEQPNVFHEWAQLDRVSVEYDRTMKRLQGPRERC
jgi:hypothetical protein